MSCLFDTSTIFETVVEPGRISIILPIKACNEANSSDHWTKKQKRHKSQKKAIFIAMLPIKHLIMPPCKVTLIRYAPKQLDAHDNLPMSFKYIVDAIAAAITDDYRPGLADGNKNLSWSYDQVKDKKYRINIIFQF